MFLVIVALMALFASAFMLGFLFCKSIDDRDTIGNLRIDHSDPDGPYVFLEVVKGTSLDYISSLEKVHLNVVVEDYIPQK